MILNPRPPIGAVRAMSLIFTRTVSMPLSSLAFSSAKFARQFSPKSSRARAIALVVLPVPAGPANRRCGRFPAFTYAFRRETTSSWPTISSRVVGRYFSTQISFMSPPGIPSKTGGLYNSLCRGVPRTGRCLRAGARRGRARAPGQRPGPRRGSRSGWQQPHVEAALHAATAGGRGPRPRRLSTRNLVFIVHDGFPIDELASLSSLHRQEPLDDFLRRGLRPHEHGASRDLEREHRSFDEAEFLPDFFWVNDLAFRTKFALHSNHSAGIHTP